MPTSKEGRVSAFNLGEVQRRAALSPRGGIAASCGVASFKRYDLEGRWLRGAAGSRFTKS